TARPRRIILFGSYVRGQMHRDSDLDILVIADDPVDNPRQESVRIRRALRGIGMPMDILVVADRRLRELADAPGLIYREALREGKVVYDRKE
ncbi:nucleotidyltransferase domain-containing protein, partial [Geoalkalibacter sp.]|uniref:nucleotidyltransferase domain-containing protein n=2 Tax=Geoalkalibacter sp. TaxID=3041440 RepID=UPI00272EE749